MILDLTEAVEVFANKFQATGIFPATGQAFLLSLSILRVAVKEAFYPLRAKGGSRGAKLLLEG